MRPLLAFLPLILTACLQERGFGPLLGDCAQSPSKVHTFGQVGIGTCLASPTDLQFFEQDGTTWLAVTNANAYQNFETGSLLLIDWDSVDLGREINYVDRLDAHAVPMDNYVGGIGYVADDYKQVVLVAGRLSEDSRTRTSDDELWVIDVSDPTDPVPWSQGDMLILKDDPTPVQVYPEEQRAFVGNITDHSISVLNTETTPIFPIDLAPMAELGEDTFLDADGSGSTAEVALTLADAEQVPDDKWTLEWVDGTARVWVPVGGPLERWNWGGLDYIPSATGSEVDPEDGGEFDAISDPYYSFDLGIPQMIFEAEGEIWSLDQVASGVWSWGSLRERLSPRDLEDWDYLAGSPAHMLWNQQGGTSLLMYYDGRQIEGGPASIGVAVVSDPIALASRRLEPILSPAGDQVSLEDPFMRADLLAQRFRMWMSIWDGTRWTIGLSESADPLTWPTPIEVLAEDGMDVAAPVVTYANGRYRMWFAHGDGVTWAIASAWSYDGVSWNDVQDVIPVGGDYDRDHPPRVAIQSDTTGGWRVTSAQTGTRTSLATASTEYVVLGNTASPKPAFSMLAANGFEVSPSVFGDAAPNGVLPISYAVVDGAERLYVTTLDAGARLGIGALERVDGEWVEAGVDLIPDGVGGNVIGAESPVIRPRDGGYDLYYTAYDGEGVGRLRRATSTDGLTFETATIQAPARGTWESAARRPHSIEPLDGGGFRLYYTGFDGDVNRIGAMTSTDGVTFAAEPGEEDDWLLGVGAVGRFDDSGVADPEVYFDGTTHHLWYAGYSGSDWAIGHATRQEGDPKWQRDIDAVTGEVLPKLFGISRTFSARGVRAPLLIVTDDGEGNLSAEGLYAGFDGALWRVGRTVGALSRLYPAQRFPTVGDTITFETKRGDDAGGVIELTQSIHGFFASGLGMSSLRLDPERGFLYVASKRTILPANYIYVLDVRDDSREGFVDRNYLDVEAMLVVGQTSYSTGFRDVVPVPGTDLLYATSHIPDAVVVFDLSRVVDDDKKDVIDDAAIASLPLRRISTSKPGRPYQDEDAGDGSQAFISGGGLAVSDDGETLFATHFRENAILAFDLRLGAYGEEIRRTEYLGENPYVVRKAPDGRYGVVANYLGDIDDEVTHSTLAVVDLDPQSPDFMHVVTWIKNR